MNESLEKIQSSLNFPKVKIGPRAERKTEPVGNGRKKQLALPVEIKGQN